MKQKPQNVPAEIEELELFPPKQAAKRTDALLRNLLASPPEPFTPKPKKKRGKK